MNDTSMPAHPAAAAAALTLLLASPTPTVQAPSLPDGYWPLERSAQVLDLTQTIRLAPDRTALSAEERATVGDLLAAGAVMQRLYEDARHRQAHRSLESLQALHEQLGRPASTASLLTLYRLNSGPIATTPDNRREPFLPVDAAPPGRNVYPWDLTREEMERFIAANPGERDALLDERSVVRRASTAALQADLATFERHPALAVLHPGMRETLARLAERPDERVLYAVPYAIAYADELLAAHDLLRRAAGRIRSIDGEFARYLDNRARDLLTNDYESGDAAWITGRFGRLNAQIGAYESYDDALYGTKAFHSLSLLVRDEPATKELRQALGSIQAIEDRLPYADHRRVRDDIPVGVYDVIADFGQARGTNTATILPNDPLFSARYGRIILMRGNILRNADIFATVRRGWEAVVAAPHRDDVAPEGGFYRTLWHEVGHYLGVNRDVHGRPLAAGLAEWAGALEEMKADLVSLFAVRHLNLEGVVDDTRLRTVQASGIQRTLQDNRPRRDQPYQTMQLAQFNYFLENGLLAFDAGTQRLTIKYAVYHDVVTALLREVLDVQRRGDSAAAATFFGRYATWDDALHGVVAARLREASGPRFRLVRYEALGE